MAGKAGTAEDVDSSLEAVFHVRATYRIGHTGGSCDNDDSSNGLQLQDTTSDVLPSTDAGKGRPSSTVTTKVQSFYSNEPAVLGIETPVKVTVLAWCMCANASPCFAVFVGA